MTVTMTKNIQKYQEVAPAQVIRAVEKAALKTGVDFNFLMEKAATESSFNPKAKAKNSSATGLFQFIEQTWLNMVKKHGDKYGLSEYADKIEMKDGRACVEDCDVKEKILNLRQNPEISALMAGEFSADNKEFLEGRISGKVAAPELYIAHFMGANGAAKFLNSRSVNPDATAAELFPNAARANKNVFFDKKTGAARSLDQIYNLFADKFTTGRPTSPQLAAHTPLNRAADAARQVPARPLTLNTEAVPTASAQAAQALPSFDDANEADDIIWQDDPRFYTAGKGFSVQRLSPLNILIMSEMQRDLMPESRRYNS